MGVTQDYLDREERRREEDSTMDDFKGPNDIPWEEYDEMVRAGEFDPEPEEREEEDDPPAERGPWPLDALPYVWDLWATTGVRFHRVKGRNQTVPARIVDTLCGYNLLLYHPMPTLDTTDLHAICPDCERINEAKERGEI